MSDAEERNNVYKEAFNIVRKKNNPTEKQKEVFEKLRNILDEDIVRKIDSFKTGNKGILLIGEDYDLMDGIISYVWYKHRLIYPMSEVDSIRSQIIGADLAGENEDRAWKILFPETGQSLHHYKHRYIVFLKNLKNEFTDMLEKIAAIIRGTGDKPEIHEERSDVIIHPGISVEDGIYDYDDPRIQRRKEGPKFKLMPSIFVVSVKEDNEEFSKEFKNKFLMIRTGQDEKGIAPPDGKEVVKEILPNTKNTYESPKLKLDTNEGVAYWCGNHITAIKGKDFDILLELAKKPGVPVGNVELYKHIDSDSHEGRLLNQRISKIRKSFPSPYKDLKNPLCIIPDAKRKKGYCMLNLTKNQVEIS